MQAESKQLLVSVANVVGYVLFSFWVDAIALGLVGLVGGYILYAIYGQSWVLPFAHGWGWWLFGAAATLWGLVLLYRLLGALKRGIWFALWDQRAATKDLIDRFMKFRAPAPDMFEHGERYLTRLLTADGVDPELRVFVAIYLGRRFEAMNNLLVQFFFLDGTLNVATKAYYRHCSSDATTLDRGPSLRPGQQNA